MSACLNCFEPLAGAAMELTDNPDSLTRDSALRPTWLAAGTARADSNNHGAVDEAISVLEATLIRHVRIPQLLCSEQLPR
jgi:hypothetical protein